MNHSSIMHHEFRATATRGRSGHRARIILPTGVPHLGQAAPNFGACQSLHDTGPEMQVSILLTRVEKCGARAHSASHSVK